MLSVTLGRNSRSDEGGIFMWVILLDSVGVVAGTLIGCAMKNHISEDLKESMNLALAVISIAIGVQLTGKAVHMSAAVLALLIGGVAGHAMGIDRRLSNLSALLPNTGGSDTAQTLLVAFSLYCLSTTGVIGALTLGFSGDSTVLMTKAIMDCAASVFFAANSGIILSVIGIPLAVILFALYALSGLLMPHITADMIGDFSACGGLIQFLNALRIAKIKNPPVADFMPALVLVFFVSMFWAAYM